MPPRVFVHGTRRPGERNAALAAGCGPPGTQAATLPASRLLHLSLENGPALVLSGPGEGIRGEVPTSPPQVWAQVLLRLDALEGVRDLPPLSRRQRADVMRTAGESEEVWPSLHASRARLTRSGGVPACPAATDITDQRKPPPDRPGAARTRGG